MTDPLHEMFQYHSWATLKLLDYCAGLPPEQLDATTPGTAGTIRSTFAHLIGADSWYLSLMTYDTSIEVANRTSLSLAELRAHFVKQSEMWEAVLGQLNELDPMIPARGSDPAIPHVRNLLLLQAFHHGNDHRTHICSVLSANGHDVPEFDGWMYWSATH
ncbi:MAG TPA: DinB family protein [Nitrolancea sp.]|jgi:uncharacterized damage-inducible protein DinB|nr:DinB family protein [Nitrolancea sp.]